MSDFTANTNTTPQEAQFGDYFALLKPRVMSLVVFTAFVGLMVAPVGVPPVDAFTAILFIALGGGASGALNMWYDRDIDQVMKRTQSRPIPSGRVSPGEALSLGLWLSALSVVMLGLAANWFAAAFLAFTIFFYAVIYTGFLQLSLAGILHLMHAVPERINDLIDTAGVQPARVPRNRVSRVNR